MKDSQQSVPAPLEEVLVAMDHVLADGDWHGLKMMINNLPDEVAEKARCLAQRLDMLEGQETVQRRASLGRALLLRELPGHSAVRGRYKFRGEGDDREIRLVVGPQESQAANSAADDQCVATKKPSPKSAEQHQVVQVAVEQLQVHPLCAEMPRMVDENWKSFVDDVRSVGIKEPVLVQQGNILLDGRHRWEAAKECGMATIPARMVDLTEADQVDLIYRSSLQRRHLTDDQRAMLISDWLEAQNARVRAEKARVAGKAGGRGRPKSPDSSEDKSTSELNGQKANTNSQRIRSRKAVAEVHKISERQLRNSLEVRKGSPDLANDVRAGKKSLKNALREIKAQKANKEVTSNKHARSRSADARANVPSASAMTNDHTQEVPQDLQQAPSFVISLPVDLKLWQAGCASILRRMKCKNSLAC